MAIQNNAGGSTTGVTASSLLASLQAQSGTNPPPKKKSSRTRRSVTVKKNETLAGIAEKNNLPYNEVRAANPAVSSVYAGMNVRLPFGETPASQFVQQWGQQRATAPFEQYSPSPVINSSFAPSAPADLGNDFVRRGGDVTLAERNKLSTAELMKAYPPINIFPNAGARNLAGSQFNNDPVSAFEYSQQATDGVRRQGVISLVDNMMQGKFLQRISGLVAPTLFSEVGAIEISEGLERGTILNALSQVYDIDPLGNLIQKGTDPNAVDPLSGFGGGGTFGRRGGGGGGRTFDPRNSGVGQNISTNMLSWRIATG